MGKTTMRRGLASGLGALALIATSVIAVPAANASGSGTACPSDRFCMYFNSDYGGARADFAYSDGSLAEELFTDGPSGRNGWAVVVNNNAASVINHSGTRVWMYTNARCTGDYWSVPAGKGMNLGTLRNKISAIWFEGTGSCQVIRDQSWA